MVGICWVTMMIVMVMKPKAHLEPLHIVEGKCFELLFFVFVARLKVNQLRFRNIREIEMPNTKMYKYLNALHSLISNINTLAIIHSVPL